MPLDFIASVGEVFATVNREGSPFVVSPFSPKKLIAGLCFVRLVIKRSCYKNESSSGVSALWFTKTAFFLGLQRVVVGVLVQLSTGRTMACIPVVWLATLIYLLFNILLINMTIIHHC